MAEKWLQAVQECDVFLFLGSAQSSRGRERELGAALMCKQLGRRKRILVSKLDSYSAPDRSPYWWLDALARGQGLPATPTAWDELYEVYPDDASALDALGLPGPTPWEPLYGPPGLWVGRELPGDQWEIWQLGSARSNFIDRRGFEEFGYLRFEPGVTAAAVTPGYDTWLHVRGIGENQLLVRTPDASYTEHAGSFWEKAKRWDQCLAEATERVRGWSGLTADAQRMGMYPKAGKPTLWVSRPEPAPPSLKATVDKIVGSLTPEELRVMRERFAESPTSQPDYIHIQTIVQTAVAENADKLDRWLEWWHREQPHLAQLLGRFELNREEAIESAKERIAFLGAMLAFLEG